MDRRILLASLILMTAAHVAEAAPERRLLGHSRPVRYEPGELLVLGPDLARFDLRADGRLEAREPSVREAFGRFGLSRYRDIGTGQGGSHVIALHSDDPGFDPRAAALELQRAGLCRAAAPNLRLDLYATVPNDPYLPLEWQVQSTSHTDVQLTSAWDGGKGDTSTVIAIMDNGLDVSHPDLADQVWINRGEIPGNGIDDDGNGYVDDVKGWDFGDHDADPSSEPMIDAASGIDIGFHGTFVAGIGAAATNNGLGIAGAGWNCRFMALKVGDATGDITLAAVTEAFQYLIRKHPAVLNMSFGTSDSTARDYFQDLVNQANAANVVCVAAAGNEGTSAMNWPAACNGVIAVGATDETNARASFSNYGPWVDVAAPGASVWSSICQNYELDFLSFFYFYLLYDYDGENPYMYGDGTSFSSPLVAGVCGLVRSKMPSLTPAQVAAHLVATGDVVAYDQPIGPRVNAYRALTQLVALGVGPETVPALRMEDAWPNPFASATTVAFSMPDAAPVRLAIYDPSGRRVRLLVNAMLPSGRHAIRWDGLDASGHASSSGVYFATLESGAFRGSRKLVLAR